VVAEALAALLAQPAAAVAGERDDLASRLS
jgi:hypothetical protein